RHAEDRRVGGPECRAVVVRRLIFVVRGARLAAGREVAVRAERNGGGTPHEVPGVPVFLHSDLWRVAGCVLDQRDLADEGGAPRRDGHGAGGIRRKATQGDPELAASERVEGEGGRGELSRG